MFNNFNDATQNGSTLSAPQIGATNASNNFTSVSGQNPNGSDFQANFVGSQQVASQNGSFLKDEFGNFDGSNIGLALGGAQVLGNLWNSYQQGKLAREQASLARETYDTNLENSTQTYNTALEDRIRARHNTEGVGNTETEQYLEENRL